MIGKKEAVAWITDAVVGTILGGFGAFVVWQMGAPQWAIFATFWIVYVLAPNRAQDELRDEKLLDSWADEPDEHVHTEECGYLD